MRSALPAAVLAGLLLAVGCGSTHAPEPDAGADAGGRDAPACTPGPSTCEGSVRVTCEGGAAAPVRATQDCAAEGRVCAPEVGCVLCEPGQRACAGNDVAECSADGLAWVLVARCDLGAGQGCGGEACEDLCRPAAPRAGMRGCEFLIVDLDNASFDTVDRNAAAEPFGVVVANPWPVRVTAHIAEPRFGRVVVVPALDSEVVELPGLAVDGGDPVTSAGATHSATSFHAYRLSSSLPVVAHQMNPLDSSTFSADGSTLLPLAALDTHYTIVGWPQTLADGPDGSAQDFSADTDDEDLRATLTVVAGPDGASVTLSLGPLWPEGASVVPWGMGDYAPVPGRSTFVGLGPFEVLNVETAGLNADFTGTTIVADQPVAVFVGSEASDAPRFDTYAERLCCADHLEEQALPDRVAGQSFVVASTYPRSLAVSQALSAPERRALFEQPHFARIVGVSERSDVWVGTLDASREGVRSLGRGESLFVDATRSFRVEVLNRRGRVHVASVLPGQAATGIVGDLPSGDPSLVMVPPLHTFRREVVFATPPSYPFDAVSIIAPASAAVRLDGAPLDSLVGPEGDPACVRDVVDEEGLDPLGYTVHLCRLSFPVVTAGSPPGVSDGEQHDGLHLVEADAPVAVIASGFSGFASYAYAGEMALVER